MPTCSNEIHVNDVGTDFQVTLYDCNVIVDLTGATTQELIFLKPDATKLTAVTTFLTNGTDGVIRYLSQAGDLDQEGHWKIQARVVLPTGEWRSDISQFRVYPNL